VCVYVYVSIFLEFQLAKLFQHRTSPLRFHPLSVGSASSEIENIQKKIKITSVLNAVRLFSLSLFPKWHSVATIHIASTLN
jgi:hypothetical protein